jgi:hypothetical protein
LLQLADATRQGIREPFFALAAPSPPRYVNTRVGPVGMVERVAIAALNHDRAQVLAPVVPRSTIFVPPLRVTPHESYFFTPSSHT